MNPAGDAKTNTQRHSRSFGSLFSRKIGAVAHFADIISETPDGNENDWPKASNQGQSPGSVTNSDEAPANPDQEIDVNTLPIATDQQPIHRNGTEVSVKPDNISRNAVKSEIDVIEIDDDDEQIEVKQKCGQSNNESSSDNENLRKKVQQLEENLAEFRRQFENKQLCHNAKSRSAVKSEIDVIEIDDDNEHTLVKQECGQSNNDPLAENEKMQKKIQELERNLAESQKQLKQLQVQNDLLRIKAISRNVAKSEIDVIEIDDGDEQTEVKQECAQASENITSESIRPKLEQNHNPTAIDQTSLEVMLDPTDHPALTDCQPAPSPVINQQSEISEESIEVQEGTPNNDLNHLTSINRYPGAISSATMDGVCNINTTDHVHGASEEVQDSNVTRTTMTTDQANDNGNTRLSEQNEVQTAEDSNASKHVTATATSVTIPTETLLLKCAKGPNKQIGSRASKPPIRTQEPLLDDEMPLRLHLRDRKQINYCDSDFITGHDLPVERKWSRLLYSEQKPRHTQKDNSLATSILNGQNQQQIGSGESTDESEFGDEVCEYRRESESNDDTLTSNSRACDNKKNTHCENNESTFQGSSRPKVRPQFKKKCQISYLKANVGPKRAVNGETQYKCKQCNYATKRKSNFNTHMRTHSGEKPYKCQFCKYATAHTSALIRHTRVHTGEKPFKCQFCKYTAAQSGTIIEHERIHTGEKPFKCQFCEFATARHNNLIQHIRIHIREKPFKCRFCRYASRCSSYLNDALKVNAANSKKDTERNLLMKSGKND